MNIRKYSLIYIQILLLFLVTGRPVEASFIFGGSKQSSVKATASSSSMKLVADASQTAEKPMKTRSTDAEAYSIMTGQPKVNPADEGAVYEDYEVNKDAKYGWFWQNWGKDKDKKSDDSKAKNGQKKSGVVVQPKAQERVSQPEIPPEDAIYIKNIEFSGNKLIPDSVLLETLQLHPGDLYTRDTIQKNLKNIYDMGYFTEKIRAVPIIHNDKNVTIRITVEENIPITGFTLVGNNSIPSDEIMEILMELLYQPQNIVKMNQTIEKIQDLYASKGYILARVSTVTDDPDGVVNVVIDEGIIKSIKIEGNKKTKDFVVKRNILLEEGHAYNETLLKQDLMRLYATQAFKDVTRTIEQNPQEPDKYDVVIQLEEQRTGSISIGGGVDTSTGLFGTAGFGDNNFRGRGQKLQANFLAGTGTILSDSSMLNRANWQAEISFFEPKLFQSDNSFLSKIYYRDYASYQVPLAIEKRIGIDATLSRQFKKYKNLTGSLGLGVENLYVKEGNEESIKSLYASKNIPFSKREEQLRDGLFVNISPGLTYDTRDNYITPRQGTLASLKFDQAVGLSNFSLSHGKLSGSIKQYIPIPHTKKAALSLYGRAAGKLYGEMPEAMAYHLGGPYSVRGFRMSAVGTGEGLVMGSAELLLPLPFIDGHERLSFLNNVRFTLFADAGKIFRPTITDELYDRPLSAISVGAGLKIYVRGIGPIGIDYGFPLTNPGSSASKTGTFTFSAGESYNY